MAFDRDMPHVLNMLELVYTIPLSLSSRDMPCSLNCVPSKKCNVVKAIKAHKTS